MQHQAPARPRHSIEACIVVAAMILLFVVAPVVLISAFSWSSYTVSLSCFPREGTIVDYTAVPCKFPQQCIYLSVRVKFVHADDPDRVIGTFVLAHTKDLRFSTYADLRDFVEIHPIGTRGTFYVSANSEEDLNAMKDERNVISTKPCLI